MVPGYVQEKKAHKLKSVAHNILYFKLSNTSNGFASNPATTAQGSVFLAWGSLAVEALTVLYYTVPSFW